MAKYQIQNQRVEIGGKTREIGDVLDETEFAPAPVLTKEQEAQGIESKTEVVSLLSTGHIIEV